MTTAHQVSETVIALRVQCEEGQITLDEYMAQVSRLINETPTENNMNTIKTRKLPRVVKTMSTRDVARNIQNEAKANYEYGREDGYQAALTASQVACERAYEQGYALGLRMGGTPSQAERDNLEREAFERGMDRGEKKGFRDGLIAGHTLGDEGYADVLNATADWE